MTLLSTFARHTQTFERKVGDQRHCAICHMPGTTSKGHQSGHRELFKRLKVNKAHKYALLAYFRLAMLDKLAADKGLAGRCSQCGVRGSTATGHANGHLELVRKVGWPAEVADNMARFFELLLVTKVKGLGGKLHMKKHCAICDLPGSCCTTHDEGHLALLNALSGELSDQELQLLKKYIARTAADRRDHSEGNDDADEDEAADEGSEDEDDADNDDEENDGSVEDAYEQREWEDEEEEHENEDEGWEQVPSDVDEEEATEEAHDSHEAPQSDNPPR
jgi:hypothetical protein